MMTFIFRNLAAIPGRRRFKHVLQRSRVFKKSSGLWHHVVWWQDTNTTTLKMEAASSSKTLSSYHNTTWYH